MVLRISIAGVNMPRDAHNVNQNFWVVQPEGLYRGLPTRSQDMRLSHVTYRFKFAVECFKFFEQLQ